MRPFIPAFAYSRLARSSSRTFLLVSESILCPTPVCTVRSFRRLRGSGLRPFAAHAGSGLRSFRLQRRLRLPVAAVMSLIMVLMFVVTRNRISELEGPSANNAKCSMQHAATLRGKMQHTVHVRVRVCARARVCVSLCVCVCACGCARVRVVVCVLLCSCVFLCVLVCSCVVIFGDLW